MIQVWEVQIQRDTGWTRWGVYLYARMAEQVRQRREQEGLTARVVSLMID